MGWILLAYVAVVIFYLPFPFHSDVYTIMLCGLALGRLSRDLGAPVRPGRRIERRCPSESSHRLQTSVTA